MKYVKIYNRNLMPIGVIDVTAIEKTQGGERFVKIKGSNMIPLGAVNIDADIASLDVARLVDVYDENMLPVGCADVIEIVPQVPEGFVDLGLPSGTLWGNMNLGATAPEEAGLYFQWGDTQGYTADQVGDGEGKKYFNWGDYKFWTADTTQEGSAYDGGVITKYNTVDGKTELDIEDDAVVAMLGEKYRMPTRAQLYELKNEDYVSKEWSILNGVNGYLITSKVNGNSIFIPIGGLAKEGELQQPKDSCNCWSLTLSKEFKSGISAQIHKYAGGGFSVTNNLRFCGLNIRPVVA